MFDVPGCGMNAGLWARYCGKFGIYHDRTSCTAPGTNTCARTESCLTSVCSPERVFGVVGRNSDGGLRGALRRPHRDTSKAAGQLDLPLCDALVHRVGDVPTRRVFLGWPMR